MNKKLREPVNSLTHLFGAILSAFAMIAMIIETSDAGWIDTLSVIVFGLSLIALYSASATYHGINGSIDRILKWRRIDHAMIFVLIAGTYTPYCLIALSDERGLLLLTIIWSVAIAGLLFKFIWFHCPRFLSTLLYILMGWIIVFAAPSLLRQVELTGVLLLLFGGIVYTLGGVIYALKPKWLESQYLGFHEIFHLFILAGSLLHFLSIYIYVL
ncbi:hemolysin III [Pelagirhabdus alkalitolerans]|uniref:Hemolysin III n=1 Tax=Pelagirhabdus alkalitolerans TaxID=1612202 RepID=A0A1G6GN04_9BACI|nr:hemolysin III family protein [Pelagirhabdus alkalitolerans]SDB82566.1 hemolysin III [Pelagirhabdus alkalitolerans]